MRSAGLEQGFGRGGAVDAFAVGGMDHRYCFGVECAVAGTGFAGQAWRGGVAGPLRAQVDFDDAVPGLAEHGALTAFSSSSGFFHPLRSLMSRQEEQKPMRSGGWAAPSIETK